MKNEVQETETYQLSYWFLKPTGVEIANAVWPDSSSPKKRNMARYKSIQEIRRAKIKNKQLP